MIEDSWNEGRNILNEFVKIFQRKALEWNKLSFGNIFFRKRKILGRLSGIQRKRSYALSCFLVNLEKALRDEYKEILEQERDLWKLKSGTNWLLEGERNTKFLHISTIVQWKKIGFQL